MNSYVNEILLMEWAKIKIISLLKKIKYQIRSTTPMYYNNITETMCDYNTVLVIYFVGIRSSIPFPCLG